jgi:ribosomal protein S2
LESINQLKIIMNWSNITLIYKLRAILEKLKRTFAKTCTKDSFFNCAKSKEKLRRILSGNMLKALFDVWFGYHFNCKINKLQY